MTFDPSRPDTTPAPATPAPATPAPATPAPVQPTAPAEPPTPAPPAFGTVPSESGPYGSAAGFAVSPVVPSAPAPKRKDPGRWLNVLLGLALVVAIGGVAFAVGRSTAPVSAATAGTGGIGGAGAPGDSPFGNGGQFPTGSGRPDFAGGNGGFGGRVGGAGGGQVTIAGTVESITADTLTLKTESGQTIQFKLDPSTTYSTKEPAASSDVATGSKVEVGLSFGGVGGPRPQASGTTTPVTGTAGSITVVP